MSVKRARRGCETFATMRWDSYCGLSYRMFSGLDSSSDSGARLMWRIR